MQSRNLHEHLIALSARLVADVLTSLMSGNRDSFSWEETLNREENASSEGNSLPEETRDRRVCFPQSNMRSEEERLMTFWQWADRAPVSPAGLAAAGFFFIGPDDRVQCFCCGGVLYDWFAEDHPMVEHKKFFPTCPFIQGRAVGNLPMPQKEEIQDCVDGQFLGILQNLNVEEASLDSQTEYPDMEMEEDRLASYRRWPSYARVSPEMLARAGFFYTGQGDYVRCFCCSGALRKWERGDDPWIEHARWFPRCKFLLLSRGQDFINSIQESNFSFPEGSLYQPGQHPANPQGQKRVSGPRSLESTLSIKEKLRQLQEERMCKVCMDKDVSIVLVPCGHLVVCSECAPNLRHCPICRGVIRDSMKAFLS